MRKQFLAGVALISFAAGYCSSPHEMRAQGAGRGSVRFDHLVRNDFFAGFAGDRAAMVRALAVTEEVLKQNPRHAEAMVWKGSATVFESGLAFSKGDEGRAQELWSSGIAMMDQAVQLEPDSIGVRIPRGSALLAVARYAPPGITGPILERALSDYGRARELQAEQLDGLGDHPKGELLSGLAEAYEGLGKKAESRAVLEKIAREMTGTPYGKRAEKWLALGALDPGERRCIGCHVTKR
jgi:tetratricopeptide (TPR) repeat protein